MVFFSGLMLESTLFMDNIGNGKKVATPGEGLSLRGDDFLIFMCLFFCLLLFLNHGLRQWVVGCCFFAAAQRL